MGKKIETNFKNFWATIEKEAQNREFRFYKKELRNMGLEHQISIYGAVLDPTVGKIKAVRFECFSPRPYTAQDVKNITEFMGAFPPIGFSLAAYDNLRSAWPIPVIVDKQLHPIMERARS